MNLPELFPHPTPATRAKHFIACLISLSPDPYCGICASLLPRAARRSVHLVDSQDEDTRQSIERRFKPSDVQASGLRGCKICSLMFRTMRRHYTNLSKYVLIADMFGWFYIKSTKMEEHRYKTFRLFSDATQQTDLGVLAGNSFVRSHPNPSARVDVDSCIRTLNFWMGNCFGDHTRRCEPAKLSVPLPTRVIRIMDNGKFHPTVNLMPSDGRHGQYLCLSHCWGKLQPDCMTTKKTLSRNLDEIPWSSLPQTFQDAIVVTRLLGKEFLWIDSICIIQDDEDDWRTEAASMSAVYEGSFLTLMATKAKDGRDGLLNKSQTLIAEEAQSSTETHGRIFFREVRDNELRWKPVVPAGGSQDGLNPLLYRAWVFQERFLSPRIAHFAADGIAYECNDGITTEWHPRSILPNWNTVVPTSNYPDNGWEFSQWSEIVKAYSALCLTYERDKLTALAGVARKVASLHASYSQGYGRYLAGLWEANLRTGLAWTCEGAVKPSEWIAPTWSWASVKGAVRMSTELQADVTLKECHIQPKGPDEFGEVSSLSINVLAQPLSAHIRHRKKPYTFYSTRPYLVETAFGDIPFQPDFGSGAAEEHLIDDGTPVICIKLTRKRALGTMEGRGLLVLQAIEESSFRRLGLVENIGWEKIAECDEEFGKQSELEIKMI